MATSNNYDELEYTWTMWHNSTGPFMKSFYRNYIELSNKAAKLNGFSDNGEMWRAEYEDPNFIENMKKLWQTVEPLYKELHEYTRNKLIKIYGKNRMYTCCIKLWYSERSEKLTHRKSCTTFGSNTSPLTFRLSFPSVHCFEFLFIFTIR